MKQKLLSLITVMTMVMSLLSGTMSIAAGAEAFSGGTGSADNPYQIADSAALAAFRDSVNGGEAYEGKFIKLTANIDLSSVCGTNIGNAEVSWTPIGNNTNPFQGTFDGGNHKITGLYINAPDSDVQGLFGYVGRGGTVKNLGAHGTVTGKSRVGGIAGEIAFTSTVQNCYHAGTVTGKGSGVGGVVGSNANDSTVQSCYHAGAVLGIDNAGGVVGSNFSKTVINCYNTGAVSGTGNCVGGVAGLSWNVVTNCYSVGTVSGTGDHVGGAVGYNNGGTVTSCYYDNTIYTAADTTSGVTGMATADFAAQTNFSGWEFGSVWRMSASLGRPILMAIPESEPHKHDMSVACEVGDSAVNFEHTLTSEGGKLYIDGTVLEPTVGPHSTYIDLPDGSYYLAEDVTLANFMKIKGDVNLCLNGHTLDMGENQIEVAETANGKERGNLKLCDCGESGKITSAHSNTSRVPTATLEVHYECSMYGGKVENTAATAHAQAITAFGGTVRLCDGEVVSSTDNAVFVDPNTGASLHLSGAPIIKGAAGKADIYLDNDYSAKIITLNAPLTVTTPYRVGANGENVFTSGWNTHMADKAFSDYFKSVTKGRFIKQDEANELKIYDYAITQQPSAANGYAVIANGAPDYAPQSHQWYSAEITTEDITSANAQTVTLPYGGEGTSSYDSETGWTGADSYHEGTMYFKISLNKGDIMKVKPSKALGEYGYVMLEGSEGMFDAEEPNADGAYEIAVEDEGEYTLSVHAGLAYGEPSPTVTAKVTKIVIGEAANGQTTNTLTGTTAGSYLCKVTYADGTVLTSDVVAYTPPEPPPTPTTRPHRGSSSGIPLPLPGLSDEPTVPEPTQEPTTEPISEAKQHKAYIVGYEGKFNPDGTMTRAETAAILSRLTDGFDENESYPTVFTDLNASLWYHNYIGFATENNIITGYPDHTFKPEESITRAEFASMIVRFADINVEQASTPFTDINGHWAQEQIAACAAAGYIKGYEDNAFLPDRSITRAEAVTIINRVLHRSDRKNVENPFTDVTATHWAYLDILEAAVTHQIENN